MPKFFSRTAILIFMALSIEPASAQMCCGANYRHGYRPSAQRVVSRMPVNPRLNPPRPGNHHGRPNNFPQAQTDSHGPGGHARQSAKLRPWTTFPQAQASPHGPGGDTPQSASQYRPQGASSAPQGASSDQPAVQSGSPRAVSYCTLLGGDTCPTLNPPGSYCECRDNFGRHFRGIAK